MGLADQVVFDRYISAITSEAIRYFGGLDLTELAESIAVGANGNDLFGCLSTRYPATWRALSHLSQLTGLEVRYEPVNAKPPVIPVGRSAPEGWRGGEPAGQGVGGGERVIEPQVQEVLRLVANGCGAA